MSETKKCAQCGHEKPIEDFSKSYKNLCKACVAENARNKRAEKPHCEDGYVSLENPLMHGMITAAWDNPQFIPHPRFIASVATMQGLLSNEIYNTSPAGLAKRAVEYADALITELKKNKDEVASDK